MRQLETCLYAEDLAAARSFYVGLLGLEVISYDPGRSLFLRLEDSVFIVFKASRTLADEGLVPPHGAVGPGHAAFRATAEELRHWKDCLMSNGVRITREIDWPNGARSLYFEDPAGNVLEFATPNLWFRDSADD